MTSKNAYFDVIISIISLRGAKVKSFEVEIFIMNSNYGFISKKITISKF